MTRGIKIGVALIAGLLVLIFVVVRTAPRSPATTAAASTSTPRTPPNALDLPSNWQVESTTNPVTGVITTVASTESGEDQWLILRQIGRKLECYINTSEFLETVDNLDSRASTVKYKFDGGSVTSQTWYVGDNNDDLFYPGNPSVFLAKMRRAQNLYFEFHPADKVAQTITFDVRAIPEAFTSASAKAANP